MQNNAKYSCNVITQNMLTKTNTQLKCQSSLPPHTKKQNHSHREHFRCYYNTPIKFFMLRVKNCVVGYPIFAYLLFKQVRCWSVLCRFHTIGCPIFAYPSIYPTRKASGRRAGNKQSPDNAASQIKMFHVKHSY